MKNSSYHKAPEKTHLKIKNILWSMKFMLMVDDKEKGIITAKRHKSLIRPEFKVEVKLKAIDENTTQVFVNAQAEKHLFNASEKKLSSIEDSILNKISF